MTFLDRVLDHVPTERSMRTMAVIALAASALISCTYTPPPPQEVRLTKPTVTYSYETGNQLVEATRKAEDYCRQFDSWPRVSTISPNTRNGRDAVFTCDRPRTAVYEPLRPLPPARPMVSYAYRDDRDLVEAMQSAERYCSRYNSRPASTNVITNADGSRTVQFDCM